MRRVSEKYYLNPMECNLFQNARNSLAWGARENSLTNHTLCCNKTPMTPFPSH